MDIKTELESRVGASRAAPHRLGLSTLLRQDNVATRTVLAHRTDELVPSWARRLAAGLCDGTYGHEAEAQKGESECVHIVLQLLTCAPRNSGHRLFST